jgi:hypothetical protein
MALTCVWEKMSIDRPDGTNLILKRGEALPDFVDDFHRTVFSMIGAVKDTGAAVAVVQAEADREFEEPPPPPVLPPEVPPVTSGPTGLVPVTPDPEVTLVRPATSDNKDVWERYAAAKGYMSQTEAEAMTKAKLVSVVTQRENDA